MFLRFLIWSIVIFFVARFIWRIVAPFLGPSPPEQPSGKVPEPTQKPTEEFKDVRDAKFIDVPKSSPSDSNGHGGE